MCPLSAGRPNAPRALRCARSMTHRETRRWRHLDTMQFKTFINCRVPRVRSSKGTKTVKVPWADNYERHTYLFERLAIDLLKATRNQTQTAHLLRCGFNVVNRIIHLSTERGMARRPQDVPYTHLSIDEKSFKKGHDYVTVLSSPNAGCVVDVAEGRDKAAAKALLERTVAPEHRAKLKTVSMDMWKAYITSVAEVFPDADMVHDRFHLVKYLNEGIDKVRRREAKHQEGLKNSRFALLKNRENLTDRQQIIFEHIQAENYEVAKAWRVREDFKSMFGLPSLGGGDLAVHKMGS